MRYRKIGRWIFIALTMIIFINICLVQAKAQRENQEIIEPAALHEYVLFYYDDMYD